MHKHHPTPFLRRNRTVLGVFCSLVFLLASCANPFSMLRDQRRRDALHLVTGSVSCEGCVSGNIVVVALRKPRRARAAWPVAAFAQLATLPSNFRMELPNGIYRFLGFEDRDADFEWDEGEPVGVYENLMDARVNARTTPLRANLFLGARDVELARTQRYIVGDDHFLRLGEVHSLDEDRFNAEAGNDAAFTPLHFLRQYGGGIFMLEDYDASRTPVVFVHGMQGYPQQFSDMIDRLDNRRFQAWIVQYPSGWSLDPVAIHLAQSLDSLTQMHGAPTICIVAHSMGGLVARRALSHLRSFESPLSVPAFITLASPFDGVAGAVRGTRMPLNVPAWSDIVPQSDFLRTLFESQLPEGTRFVLMAAQRADEDTDGTIALSSQLRPEARAEAAEQRTFTSTHSGVLRDLEAVRYVQERLLECVSNSF